MTSLVSAITTEIVISASALENKGNETENSDKVDFSYTIIDGFYSLPDFYKLTCYCNKQEYNWNEPCGFDVSAYNIVLKGKKLLRFYDLSYLIERKPVNNDWIYVHLYLFEDGSHVVHDMSYYKNQEKDYIVASVTDFDFLDNCSLVHYHVVGFTSTSVIISFRIDRSQCGLHPCLVPLTGPHEKFINDMEEDTLVVFDLSAPFIYHSYNEIPSRSGCFIDQTMGEEDYVHLRDVIAQHFSVEDLYQRLDDESVYEEEIKEEIIEMIDYLHHREDFELLYQLFSEVTTERKESFQMHAHLRHNEVNLQDLEHNDFIIRDISIFSRRFDEGEEYTARKRLRQRRFQPRAYEMEISLRDKTVSYCYIIDRVCAQSMDHVFIVRYSDNSIELFESKVSVDYKKEQTLSPYLVPITELEQCMASNKSCMVIGCVEGQLLCLMSGHNGKVYEIEAQILRSVVTDQSFLVE